MAHIYSELGVLPHKCPNWQIVYVKLIPGVHKQSALYHIAGWAQLMLFDSLQVGTNSCH